jgi:hypothetical protein
MIIYFLGVHINISRLLTFACILTVIVIVQSKLVLAVDATTPKTLKYVQASSHKTTTLEKKHNETKTTDKCVAEVIDETLYYFSVGYRAFAGALVVPITICAIVGNSLVIYVIKRYHSLRITGNVFLASLAVADVGVSTLAMTFYGLQLLYGRWLFGPVSLLIKLMNVNYLKEMYRRERNCEYLVFYYDANVCINESQKCFS